MTEDPQIYVPRFQWVKCQLDELAELRTIKEMRQALKSLPTDLHETYQRILSRVNRQDTDLARKALTWLAFSRRVLSLDELAEAIIIDPDATAFDDELRLRSPQELLHICGSLITYVEEDRGAVILAHTSVKDFLLSDRTKATIPTFYLEQRHSELEISIGCLSYLLLESFADGACKSVASMSKRVAEFPLLDYASVFWPQHVLSISPMDENLFSLVTQLMHPSVTPNFAAWVQNLILHPSFRNHPEHFNGYIPRTFTPLYYASSYGLRDVVSWLLAEGVRVNDRGGFFGGTALHAAAWRGHWDIYNILVKAGADESLTDFNSADPTHLISILKARENLRSVSTLNSRLSTTLSISAPKGKSVSDHDLRSHHGMVSFLALRTISGCALTMLRTHLQKILVQGGRSVTADVIFIHGAESDPQRAWSKDIHSLWPQDYLAVDLPDVRIATVYRSFPLILFFDG